MENASGEINRQAGGNNNVFIPRKLKQRWWCRPKPIEAEGFENTSEIDYEDVSVELTNLYMTKQIRRG